VKLKSEIAASLNKLSTLGEMLSIGLNGLGVAGCSTCFLAFRYTITMLLAIDAGNTNVKFGVFDGSLLRFQWRIRTYPGRTADEYAALLSTLFTSENVDFSDIDGIVLASSAAAATPDLERLAHMTFHKEPLKVSAALDLGFHVAYSPPTDVGQDRLADAASVLGRYGDGPSIFIDFGTGTTFNAIGKNKSYLGGAIYPGVALSWDALFARASRLSRVEMEAPPTAIGQSTRQSLQSGMLHGVVTMVDGMVELFRAELGSPNCRVIATGGNLTDILVQSSRTITDVDPNLTLEGLRIIYERNR
jgi:type III pantothenate kinase